MKLYIDIITEHSKVVKVGLECQVFDRMRKEIETFIKKPAQFHLQLRASRRIVLTRTKQKNVLVRGKYTYKSDLGEPKPSINKTGENVVQYVNVNFYKI